MGLFFVAKVADFSPFCRCLIDWWLGVKGANWFGQECIIRARGSDKKFLPDTLNHSSKLETKSDRKKTRKSLKQIENKIWSKKDKKITQANWKQNLKQIETKSDRKKKKRKHWGEFFADLPIVTKLNVY